MKFNIWKNTSKNRATALSRDILELPPASAYIEPYRGRNRVEAGSLDRNQHDDLVTVRRCTNRRQAEQYALVLTAMGVWSLIEPDGQITILYVAPEDAARAIRELNAYDSENRRFLPRTKRVLPASPSMEVAMIYWAVLLFFFAATRSHTFSFDWVGEGAAQAGLILQGELWRTVTALSLHVSVSHLFGNLIFGTVILLLLAQVTGTGVAWLAMIIAGAFGNFLNALVQSPEHASIGASTAVFAGVGLLAAFQQVWRGGSPTPSLRKWIPLVGGATLLGFLGLSGENTDILGHVLGFGSGVIAGWLLKTGNSEWFTDQVLQWKCTGAAALIVVASWLAAAF